MIFENLEIAIVINGTAGVVTGTREDWKNYKSTYSELKHKMAANMVNTRDSSGRKHEFYFHVISEWTQWGKCDGCVGLRSKMAECKLIPTPTSNLKVGHPARFEGSDFNVLQSILGVSRVDKIRNLIKAAFRSQQKCRKTLTLSRFRENTKIKEW